MKIKIPALVFIFLLAFQFASYSQGFKTRIQGEVFGWDNKELLLVPITENFSNITILLDGISIPIRDNKFDYTLESEYIEAYMLIFKEEAAQNGFMVREFLNDSSVIKVSLYPDSLHIKNSFQGGNLNNLMQNRRRKLYGVLDSIDIALDSLRKTDGLYTTEYQNLQDAIARAKDVEEKKKLIAKRNLLKENNKVYSELGQELFVTYDSLWSQEQLWKKNYIEDNDDQLAFVFLYQLFERIKEADPEMVKDYKRLSANHPHHPYTGILADRIETLKMIRVGGRYINFTAPTIDGDFVSLSNIIEGKVALINLWSTWCSPCLRKNMSMIPVYEKYKESGFEVVGVAGVYKNTDDYRRIMKRDKYPWLNLIELNNQNLIWFKYGISGAGGATYLVNSAGEILAIDPTSDQLDTILSDILN